MARVLDITDKLTFDSNPALIVKGEKLEVRGDAPTLLKIMGLVGGGNPSPDEIMEAYDLIFTDSAKRKIEKLKVNFSDLMVLIQEAIGLIAGGNDTGGEQ